MDRIVQQAPPHLAGKDSLGCESKTFAQDFERRTESFHFYRKATHDARLSRVTTPASDRGVLVGISLTNGHRRAILRGRHAATHDFAVDSIYVRDFSEEYRADLHADFDFVLVEIPLAVLTDLTGQREVRGIAPAVAHHDRLLGQIGRTLALALAAEDDTMPLLLDHLGLAIGTHLLHAFGQWPRGSGPRHAVLSALHEARAKDMLMAGVRSIDEIATACGLSRSYFIKAFRGSTQTTPHQWLLEQRVAAAKELLLRSDWTLERIALHCGFSSQSHFTHAFASLTGTPPGAWRRRADTDVLKR
ncbi:AraC family transcriptional regulator [Burkholderia sp. Bp8963]|nr:AraC family transcriptional regulator [Burkholderia sp. Bp8963]